MSTILTIYERARLYDPTHTTHLRNAFARDMKTRMNELCQVIIQTVAKNDCFGLRRTSVQIHQMNPALPGSFDFSRSSDKVEAFMQWLNLQVEKGLLEVKAFQQVGSAVEAAWTNLYIMDSYKRGLLRARDELRRAGINVPPELESGINMAMLPMHMDRVGLLFTRTFSDLKGITSTMESQIARVLAQGIADGDNPNLLARKLVSTVTGDNGESLGITDTLGRYIPARRRAVTLARTEIIRAHHLATIQEYRNWGLLGASVLAEWDTADDDRVCPKCAPLDGKIFTLEQIENMIPQHPNCRCIALPVFDDVMKLIKK